MSFFDFINKIFSIFNEVFNNIIDLFNIIFNNNFIKFMLMLSVLYFICQIISSILNIIFNILDVNHDKAEEKKLFKTLNNKEIQTNSNNIHKKIKNNNIWW